MNQRNLKLKVFQAWQQVIVQMKLIGMQSKTSDYLRRKNMLIKGFHALKSYTNYRLRHRLQETKADLHYNYSLKTLAMGCLFLWQQKRVQMKLKIRRFCKS